ncbi:MAG: hypothetical protein ACYC7L_08100 [Nitrospirota bacterium]
MHIQRVRLTGTNSRAALADVRRAISKAQGLGELLPLVVMLLQETESMMNGRTLNEDDIRRIAAPLAKIRFLLTTIATRGCVPDDSSPEGALVRDLIEHYEDIEGRIKEMRNDLSGAHKPRRP